MQEEKKEESNKKGARLWSPTGKCLINRVVMAREILLTFFSVEGSTWKRGKTVEPYWIYHTRDNPIVFHLSGQRGIRNEVHEREDCKV